MGSVTGIPELWSDTIKIQRLTSTPQILSFACYQASRRELNTLGLAGNWKYEWKQIIILMLYLP